MTHSRTDLMRQVQKLQASRQYARAKVLMQDLIQRYPARADVSYLYAGLLKAMGEYALAIDYYNKTLAANPVDASCWNDLGTARLANGQIDDAIACFDKALQFSPDSFAALMNLGTALHKLHDTARARDAVGRALALRPDVAPAHLLMGNIHKSAGHLDEAIDSYRQATRLRPTYYQAWYNLALALTQTDAIESALECCNTALSLKPDHIGALLLCGQLNEYLGRIEAAEKLYLHSIAISPESTEAYWNFANLGHAPFPPSVVATMKALVQQAMPDEDKVYLLFALARAMEQLEDYPSGFAYLQQANQLKHAHLGDQVVDAPRLIEALRTAFNANVMARISNAGNSAASPVFVIGMVRSGTSLVEQILASHSDVAGGGELETSLQLFFDELPRLSGRDWRASVDRLDADQLQQLAARYCERNRALVDANRLFTDKLPFNFALVGFLSALFPNARFVHVYKHPLDACLSSYKQLFTVGQEFTYSLEDLADYYQQYLLIMRHWTALLPQKIQHVRYASLVDAPRPVTKSLLAFLALPWQDECLAFHRRAGVVKTASAGQVRQGLYASSSGRWKHYQPQLAALADTLAPAIADYDSAAGLWPYRDS